jgi:hypothetical protein
MIGGITLRLFGMSNRKWSVFVHFAFFIATSRAEARPSDGRLLTNGFHKLVRRAIVAANLKEVVGWSNWSMLFSII